jgi:calcium-dependent protein kinase
MGSVCCKSGEKDHEPSVYSSLHGESGEKYIGLDDNFSLSVIIGTGKFSEVRRAYDNLGKPIAIKCVKISFVRNQVHLLKREISILQSLDHENVIKLYSVYQDVDYLYLVMEYCAGGNLQDRLQKAGRMPEHIAKKLARELLSALAYMHTKNIGHRDLKPENILFTEDGVAKIADFGFARYIKESRSLSTVGTPLYIAPEIIKGNYNSKCDIWSLGITLYYSMLGRPPYIADSIEELFSNITQHPIDWSGLSTGASGFLKELLEKNPDKRKSASELLSHEWLGMNEENV